MIDLGSIAGLCAHDLQLAAYCPRCDAWRVLPLGESVSQGQGIAAPVDQVAVRGL